MNMMNMPPSLIQAETSLSIKATNYCYDEDELLNDSSHTHRSSSFDDIDASTHEFWNMTLDDHLEACTAPSSSSPCRCPPRRGSDGEIVLIKKKSLPRRNVSFDKVKVRVCERVLGDNPSCKGCGPSLSIGWNYHAEEYVAPVDDFEAKRDREGRRSYQQLQLSPARREKIAKRQGYTTAEINANIEKMAKYQRRRDRTRKEVEKEENGNDTSLLAELFSSSSSKNNSSKNTKKTLKRFLQAGERSSSSCKSGAGKSTTSTSRRRSSANSSTSSRDSAATALSLRSMRTI